MTACPIQTHSLGSHCIIKTTRLPDGTAPPPSALHVLWNLHPPARPVIRIHGKRVRIPRWQQAYEVDYAFSDAVSPALPIDPAFEPFLRWTREHIDPRLNGLLVNWYDLSSGN